MRRIKHMFIDFSSIDMFRSCPRLAELSLVEALVPKVEIDPSAQTTFKGTVVHECFDALYHGQDWRRRFGELLADPSIKAIKALEPQMSGSVEHLFKVIETYIKHYEAPADRDFSIIATERRMEMPLRSWLTYAGHVDKVAVHKATGRTVIIDHKTSSSLRSWVEPSVPISDQFTGYIALAQANGIPAESLFVDGVSTAKKALDEYEKGKDGNGLFARYEAIRTKEHISEWAQITIEWASRFKAAIEETNFPPRKGHPCVAFGGRCQFFDVCASASSAGLNILRNSFMINPSPWKGFRLVWED